MIHSVLFQLNRIERIYSDLFLAVGNLSHVPRHSRVLPHSPSLLLKLGWIWHSHLRGSKKTHLFKCALIQFYSGKKANKAYKHDLKQSLQAVFSLAASACPSLSKEEPLGSNPQGCKCSTYSVAVLISRNQATKDKFIPGLLTDVPLQKQSMLLDAKWSPRQEASCPFRSPIRNL